MSVISPLEPAGEGDPCSLQLQRFQPSSLRPRFSTLSCELFHIHDNPLMRFGVVSDVGYR